MCKNRVVHNRVVYHESHSIVPWTTVYGEELLNFLSIASERYRSAVLSWRCGEQRCVYRGDFEECLSRFPLEYVVDVDE